MATDTKSTKDIWDKLDIVGKIVSGIVLVAIAIVLERGSNKIANSMQSGQLVQSLISDLAVPDTTIKQDIALIALNHAVGAQNPALVLQICERILENTKDYDDITGKVAFEIIRDRDPERAKQIEKEALEIAQREQSIQRSAAVPSSQPSQKATELPSSKFISRVLQNIVYIQIRNNAYREQIKRLQDELQFAGFTVPGIEQVESDFRNSIRYFHEENRSMAERIKQIAVDFFQDEGIYLDISIQNLSNTEMSRRTSPGRVEIWINLERN